MPPKKKKLPIFIGVWARPIASASNPSGMR
eukprot:SAG22_NODE_648_length_8185_cov_242.957828_7_plen_30_part_00